ncbi:MAG: right-handed parallel beta-helix repeat-containing protein [Sphingomonas sp.]|uniref:right-handed parallel beta-helix repeat-containing protein n=1 Tax=Sphingomonas sp. TaxID=28214 RepID=UPI001AD42360|nr:right-handed parallel beta-helix repeat-containing protein [Sphingomonas sp.]MBN8816779.1 right-handed parallel beta-helix repeat-containing protein [Sphingomonas sp.]
MRRVLFALLPLVVAPAAGLAAESPSASFTIAETGQGFANLDDAVQSVRMGTATILIAPGVYKQCTVQAGGNITFKAVQPGTAIFDGTACEGKAAFVLRGQSSVVDGIVFRNIRVSDGNGAGIRTEMGDLTVRNSMFLDSQEGILGGQPTGQKIVIERSTFAGLGQCDETVDCSHSIYLANKGSVTITRSRFERGTGGHYVKLRVPNVSITDNSFDDSQGRKTNYMIDLSEGGTGLIARNTFADGPNKENWTAFIVVAAEVRTYSSAGLRVVDNVATLAPNFGKSPAFVANVGRDQLTVGANKLAPGIRLYEQR